MKSINVNVTSMWQSNGNNNMYDLSKYTLNYTFPICMRLNDIPESLTTRQVNKMTIHLYADGIVRDVSWLSSDIPSTINKDIANFMYWDDYNSAYKITSECYYSLLTRVGSDYRYDAPFYVATFSSNAGWILTGTITNLSYLSKAINGHFGLRGSNVTVYSPLSNYPPYAVLEYDEGTLTTYGDSPRSYVKPSVDNVFSWHTTYDGFPLGNYAETAATLYWKDGTNGTEHSIAISDGATSYTIPANTLPESSSLMWRVVATTAEGTSSSSWQTLRTTDAIPTTTALAPSGSFLDGSEVIRFSWAHDIDTGTAQTAYELQYLSGGTWTTAATAETADEYCDLPANTLASGSTQWRVKTRNQDNVYGEYSNALPIVVVAAPLTPSVSISQNTPRPTITWASNDQQAYETRFGGAESGLIWGTAKSAKSPVYLPDGINLISVRVCNAYNMWSGWGTASVTIANAPGETSVTLTGTGGLDAELSWTALTGAAEYWIYRGGKRIAVTTETSFTDRYFLGTATYFVRAAHSSGDTYTDSNTVTLTLTADAPMITAQNGQWISLAYDQTDVSTITTVSAQGVALMEYSGAEYPAPETSPHKSQAVSLSTAFTSLSEARNFAALLGKLVCYKDQYGTCIIGVMTETQKIQHQFFTAFAVTIQRVEEDLYAAT